MAAPILIRSKYSDAASHSQRGRSDGPINDWVQVNDASQQQGADKAPQIPSGLGGSRAKVRRAELSDADEAGSSLTGSVMPSRKIVAAEAEPGAVNGEAGNANLRHDQIQGEIHVQGQNFAYDNEANSSEGGDQYARDMAPASTPHTNPLRHSMAVRSIVKKKGAAPQPAT